MPGVSRTHNQGDVRTIDLGQQFDVVTMLFSVLGYQNKNTDVLQALRTVHKHLKPGGLFIFDVWYGPGVLLNKPVVRIKELKDNDRHIIRQITPSLGSELNLCKCDYRLWVMENGKVETSSETHLLRYFFPLDVQMMAEVAGLELIRYCKPGTAYRHVDNSDWTCTFICSKTME